MGKWLLLWVLLVPSTSLAAEPGRAREAIDAVLSDPRYQRARPDGSMAPQRRPPPPEDFELPDFGGPAEFSPSAASGISEALLYVLLGVFGFALVALVVREAMRWRSRRRRTTKAAGKIVAGLDVAQMALERLPATLARARALAAEGRYEEAVHVLLEGGIGYLHALADFTLEPAFTSREVLARAPLTSDTRAAFKDLVMTVEVSLFGGLPVGSGDFGRCEASIVTLHQRLAGGLVG